MCKPGQGDLPGVVYHQVEQVFVKKVPIGGSLFVGSAEQPCLVVNDLKLGDVRGEVGLWVGSGTVGYFRELRITPAERVQ